MKQFSDWWYRVSTGRLALLGFVFFVLVFAFALSASCDLANKDPLPKNIPCLRDNSPSPQECLYYSADDLKKFSGAYEQAGRECFIRFTLTFDSVIPLALVLVFTLAISWRFGKAFSATSLWWVNLTPLAGMLFDYLENLANVIVMARYDAPTPIIDALAGYFTLLKWTFVFVNVLLLFGGPVVVRWFLTRSNSSK